MNFLNCPNLTKKSRVSIDFITLWASTWRKLSFFTFHKLIKSCPSFFFLFANLELSSRKFLYFSINQTCPFFFSWENFYKIYIQNSFVRNMLMIFFLLFFNKQNSSHLKQRLEIYIETLPPFYHYVD